VRRESFGVEHKEVGRRGICEPIHVHLDDL
jgi:hypothetical protein